MVFMARTVVELVMTVAQVTMVELDEGVMEAVRVFMPSVAEGVLDNYKGERSKVGRGHQRVLVREGKERERRRMAAAMASFLAKGQKGAEGR